MAYHEGRKSRTRSHVLFVSSLLILLVAVIVTWPALRSRLLDGDPQGGVSPLSDMAGEPAVDAELAALPELTFPDDPPLDPAPVAEDNEGATPSPTAPVGHVLDVPDAVWQAFFYNGQPAPRCLRQRQSLHNCLSPAAPVPSGPCEGERQGYVTQPVADSMGLAGRLRSLHLIWKR